METGNNLDTWECGEAPAKAIAFSPTGDRLAVGNHAGGLQVWDVKARALLWCFTLPSQDSIEQVAFSQDGRRLAAGGLDRAIRLWDAWTGTALETIFSHTERIRALALSPDGKTLAAAGQGWSIKLWNLATGKLLRECRREPDWIERVARSTSHHVVVTAGVADNVVKVWDVSARLQPRCKLEGHTGRVLAVALSPNVKRVASGSEDRSVRIWDAQTGKELCRREGHAATVVKLAFWAMADEHYFHRQPYGEHWPLVAITVGVALVGVVLWGTLSGSMLPFILRRIGADPATSSAPFVATLVDVTGLIIYFSIALLIMRGAML